MISFKADLEKNCLFAKSSGVICPETLKKSFKDMKEQLMLLEEGFCIINDISETRTFDPENFKILYEAHQILEQHKPGHIIRIVGPAKDTLFKFAKFDIDYNINNVQYVPDMESALAILNNSSKK